MRVSFKQAREAARKTNVANCQPEGKEAADEYQREELDATELLYLATYLLSERNKLAEQLAGWES